MNKQKHLQSDEYINDLEEWMEHQYDPGYWTGGNIPPHIKYVKRPSRLILLLLGVFTKSSGQNNRNRYSVV